MVISPQGLLRDVAQRFSDTARATLPSVGEPSWFAPPIDVRGDGDSLTILFHVPEDATRLHVESCGATLVLRARLPGRARRGSRIFALPFEAQPGSVKTSRSGEIVEVTIRRLHPGTRIVTGRVEREEQAR